jgi:hypothetical protein
MALSFIEYQTIVEQAPIMIWRADTTKKCNIAVRRDLAKLLRGRPGLGPRPFHDPEVGDASKRRLPVQAVCPAAVSARL